MDPHSLLRSAGVMITINFGKHIPAKKIKYVRFSILTFITSSPTFIETSYELHGSNRHVLLHFNYLSSNNEAGAALKTEARTILQSYNLQVK